MNDRDRMILEDMQQAATDEHEPEPDGKKYGIPGIAVGIIGLFLPLFLPALAGVAAATLGVLANKFGARGWGIACGIIALVDMAGFLLFVGQFNYL